MPDFSQILGAGDYQLESVKVSVAEPGEGPIGPDGKVVTPEAFLAAQGQIPALSPAPRLRKTRVKLPPRRRKTRIGTRCPPLNPSVVLSIPVKPRILPSWREAFRNPRSESSAPLSEGRIFPFEKAR